MHQQPGDRSCTNEAIGGSHYGPVIVYMAAVADATSATGADSAWFKVFQDTWASNGTSGSEDNWGTKDLNTCCGMMDVLIPADLPAGDYLLRAEAIALHSAAGASGAQFYITCYQLTVTGSGTAAPDTVAIPGAYDASDPGILINIYQSMTTYAAPGPTVYSGGSTKSAGAPCASCESTCTAGSGSSGVAASGAAVATSAVESSSSAAAAVVTSSASATSSTATTSSADVAVAAAATPSETSSSVEAAATGKSCNKKRRAARRSN